MTDGVQDAEDRLRRAMLASDVAELDLLLAPELVFTHHMGGVVGKKDDLDAHRSGAVKIDAIELSESQIHRHAGVAIVTVRARIAGHFGGQPASGDFRFTRVWAPRPAGGWHIVVAHSCKAP